MTDEQFIAEAIDGYTECLVWQSLHWADENTEPVPLDSVADVDDLTAEAREEIAADVRAFVLDNRADTIDAGMDASQCGHDFCLTRNRHGAGFWDRGLGERGARLTDAAHVYGSSDAYLGDDGALYVS